MQKELIEKNPILKLTLEFSRMVIEYCKRLETDRESIIARRLLRSGTSIGANSMEAQDPESKADVIHKIKIAANYPDCEALFNKLEEIQRVVNKILGIAKRRNPLSYLLSYLIF